jgi:hypothetical protein
LALACLVSTISCDLLITLAGIISCTDTFGELSLGLGLCRKGEMAFFLGLSINSKRNANN